MNPFDDLPAPVRASAPLSAKREREREEEEKEEQEPQAQPQPSSPAPETKKARVEVPPQPPEAQVAAALTRLTTHLRSCTRVSKAGPLLRQLLDGAVAEEGAAADAAPPPPPPPPAAFDAVAAAFSDPSQFLSCAPAARLEYARIARSAQRFAWKRGGGEAGDGGAEEDAAADAEAAASPSAAAAALYCAECAAAWSLLRLELLGAEDGFALSRALAKLKALIDALPAWEEGDEVEEEAKGEEKEEGEAPQPPPRPLPPPPPVSWPPSPARVLLLRRRAALDCVLCARDRCHGMAAWAAPAVELALEHAASRADRFAPGAQRARAEALPGFVAAARAARRAGGAAGAAKGTDDRGAFERARAQFATAGGVSARGSVGLGGGGAAQWLG